MNESTANRAERPKLPKLGTVDHLLATILSWGCYVEVVPIADSRGPNTCTAAIRRLRQRGHVIRELSVQGPTGQRFASVFRLDVPVDPDVLDEDGAVPVISLIDSTGRALVRGPRRKFVAD